MVRVGRLDECEPGLGGEWPEGWTRWQVPPPRGRWLTLTEEDLARGGTVPAWNERDRSRMALRRMVGLVLEVLSGDRTADHLYGVTSPEVQSALVTRVRTGPSGRTYHLSRLHTCRPTATAVEVCATVRITDRRSPDSPLAALTGRVELHDGRWKWTALRPLFPQRGAVLPPPRALPRRREDPPVPPRAATG